MQKYDKKRVLVNIMALPLNMKRQAASIKVTCFFRTCDHPVCNEIIRKQIDPERKYAVDFPDLLQQCSWTSSLSPQASKHGIDLLREPEH